MQARFLFASVPPCFRALHACMLSCCFLKGAVALALDVFVFSFMASRGLDAHSRVGCIRVHEVKFLQLLKCIKLKNVDFKSVNFRCIDFQ